MIARSVSSRPCPFRRTDERRVASALIATDSRAAAITPSRADPRALASPSTMPSTTSHPSRHAPRIALAPEGAPEWLETAIIAGGGHVVPPEKAEALVWASPRDPD